MAVQQGSWQQDSWQQSPLKKTKLNDKISISLPETFRPMTENEIVSSYTIYRKPLAMYLDDRDPKVHLGVNTSASRWSNSDMDMLKDFYKATIFDMYSKVEFIQEDVKEIDGKKFAVFEFSSVMKPTEKEQETAVVVMRPVRQYYYIQYTVVDGKVMIFNFSSPMRLQKYWSETAKKMMQSVKIK